MNANWSLIFNKIIKLTDSTDLIIIGKMISKKKKIEQSTFTLNPFEINLIKSPNVIS